MSWNPPGMEPELDPLDHHEPGYPNEPGYPPRYAQPPDPYDPRFGAPDAYGWQPGYGQPNDYDSDDEETERPGRTVTPLRVMALVALVGSGAVAAYSLLIARGSQTIAVTVAALGVFGLTSALVAFALAGAGVRAARDGRVGRACLGGLFGGLFMLGAAGAIAAAVILGLLSRL